jgi:hypothetical protein
MSPAAGRSKPQQAGVRAAAAAKLLRSLPGVEHGQSYGMPAFKANGRFLARFRDDDTVLVLTLGSIAERDLLVQLDPVVFFFTDHYRNYPTVLIRLGDVTAPQLADVVRDAYEHAMAQPKAKPWARARRRRAG